MKQVAVVSGKGGTGKTSLTAALAHLASSDGLAGRLVIADADVDAANLALILRPRLQKKQIFVGGKVAVIDPACCASCGDCAAHCRFEAIIQRSGQWTVDPLACEGCGVCTLVCPNNAVVLKQSTSGQLYQSTSRYGPLVHARLLPAHENSGKLVSRVRGMARQIADEDGKHLIMIDGPPGIGCPVIAALTGVNLALIVTEPTLSGSHDLARIAGLTNHFGIPSLVCVNKADLNPDGTRLIQSQCQGLDLKYIGSIPYDPALPAAMAAAQPVTQHVPDSPASQAIQRLWLAITQALNELHG